jgi:hypothetical protein
MLVLSVLFLLFQTNAFPQTFELRGMLSGWITGSDDETRKMQIALRYIPTLSVKKPISKRYTFDAELSLNAYGFAQLQSFDSVKADGKIKPYRMWLRFSSSQFEARFGLQRISFGSATLLRPLMWFDRIDPRDPLKITDGVYCLLFRYYFINNTNIWVWGLYGNDEPKGLEINPTEDKSLEYGGRFQAPLLNGEIAFTYHHRRITLNKELYPQIKLGEQSIPENRIAVDGKWDIGIGLWFEGVVIHQNSKALPFPWRRAITIGLDYTFGIGNGLNVLGEHFILENSEKAFGPGRGITFSALLFNYPLGLLDNMRAIVYYDWKNKELYRFVHWQRTYDRLSFHVIGFWNPEQFLIYQNQEGDNLFAGKGFQIMFVFNH